MGIACQCLIRNFNLNLHLQLPLFPVKRAISVTYLQNFLITA